jgi:hypothetical protein
MYCYLAHGTHLVLHTSRHRRCARKTQAASTRHLVAGAVEGCGKRDEGGREANEVRRVSEGKYRARFEPPFVPLRIATLCMPLGEGAYSAGGDPGG